MIESATQNFRFHCAQSFMNSDNQRSNSVVYFFENFSKITTDKILNEEDICAIGFFKTNSIWIPLFDELLDALHSAKDDERRKFHLNSQKAKLQQLDQLFKNLQRPQNVNVDHICISMKEFVNKYKSTIGAHPFLRGLRTVFETQKKHHTNVIGWRFEKYVLSESAGEKFAHESVNILSYSFILKNVDDDYCEWWTDEKLSKSVVQKFLSVLPKHKAFQTKPTGKVFIASSKTTPQKKFTSNKLFMIMFGGPTQYKKRVSDKIVHKIYSQP